MFYVSEQESFSAGGITPPVLLTGKERGGYGRKCNHDHGADFGFPDRLLWGALLENDEGVRQPQGGNGKSH